MKSVSQADAVEHLPALLKEVATHPVVIREGDAALGALVSMQDYELVRHARVERLLEISDELGTVIRTRASIEGLSVDDLMKLLDRKAS